MLNSLQNGSCSFNFTTLIIHTTNPTIPTANPFFNFSQLSPPYSTLIFLKKYPYVHTNTPFFYTAAIYNPIPAIYTKNFFPTSAI